MACESEQVPDQDLVRRLFLVAASRSIGHRDAWLEASSADAETIAATKRLLDRVTDVVDQTAQDSLIGMRFGRWRLVRLLGQGGTASVYEGIAQEPWDGPARAAVKLPRTPTSEAARSKLVEHPQVASVLEEGDSPQPWIAMELIEYGEPLLDAAAEHGRAIDTRIGLILDAADAVAAIHAAGLVHGDLSPSNLLVDAAGRVHVVDLGLSRKFGSAGCGGGTLAFMAPELFDASVRVSPAADVYALAAILYRLLSGSNPCPVPTDPVAASHVIRNLPPIPISGSSPGLPSGLSRFLGECLSKDPARRPSAADRFAEELRGVLHGVDRPRNCGRLMTLIGVACSAVVAGSWLAWPAATVQSAYAKQVLANVPAGYWRLHERDGPAINHGTAGKVSDGVWSGDVDRGVDGIDGAAYFRSGSVACPSSPGLHLNGSLSIELWFRLADRDSPGTTYALSKGRDTAAGFYRLTVGHGERPGTISLHAAGQNATPVLDRLSLPADVSRWHHLVWTVDEESDRQRMWFDAKMIADEPLSGGLFGTNDEPLIIGRHGQEAWAYYHRGWLDEVAVYRGVLPNEAIERHFEVGMTSLH